MTLDSLSKEVPREQKEYTFDVEKVDTYFPFNEYRKGQREAIQTILSKFQEGKKVFILEGPTGVGKSVIGYTVAQYFDRVYWICPQKILQDQIMEDFGDSPRRGLREIVDLKGRNAYPCNYWDIAKNRFPADSMKMKSIMSEAKRGSRSRWVNEPKLSCSEGVCRLRDKKPKCEECFISYNRSVCPYWSRLFEAKAADICLMNFSSFIFQTSVTQQFGPRDLLIVDETHGVESELLDFISLTLDDRKFSDIKFPKFEEPSKYIDYFEEIGLKDIIAAQVLINQRLEKIKEADEWAGIGKKYEAFTRYGSDDSWVCKFESKKSHNVLELKPVFVDKFARHYILDKADRVLMMSATVLDPGIIRDSLGIRREETYAWKLQNRFPAENRPIIYWPSGQMNFKNKLKTLPKMVEDVSEICENYEGYKGIIHTHNFEIAKRLVAECSDEAKKRFLFQENWPNKKQMLRRHARSEDTIIVAPAMHEGLDLKDSLARFQIICKVPYPPFVDNPQLKLRMELSYDYYNWLTALKLVQSYGRSVRSDKDWADTFVLDEGFVRFSRNAKKMLPGWFLDAIVYPESRDLAGIDSARIKHESME